MVLEKFTNVRSQSGGRLEDTRSGISRRNRVGIAIIESCLDLQCIASYYFYALAFLDALLLSSSCCLEVFVALS